MTWCVAQLFCTPSPLVGHAHSNYPTNHTTAYREQISQLLFVVIISRCEGRNDEIQSLYYEIGSLTYKMRIKGSTWHVEQWNWRSSHLQTGTTSIDGRATGNFHSWIPNHFMLSCYFCYACPVYHNWTLQLRSITFYQYFILRLCQFCITEFWRWILWGNSVGSQVSVYLISLQSTR